MNGPSSMGLVQCERLYSLLGKLFRIALITVATNPLSASHEQLQAAKKARLRTASSAGFLSSGHVHALAFSPKISGLTPKDSPTH